MDFRESQLGQILEQIKIAMLTHVPVVYMPTNQLEVVEELLWGENAINALIPRVRYDCNKSETKLLGYNEKFESGTSIADNYFVTDSDCKNLRVPSLFLYRDSDWRNISNKIERFVNCYLGIKNGKNYEEPDQIELYRRSLCLVVTPIEYSIPAVLAQYVRTIKVPPLSDEEIESTIRSRLDENGIKDAVIGKQLMDQYIVTCRGFSRRQISNIFDQLITRQIIDFDYVNERLSISIIQQDKRRFLENCPGIKWEELSRGVAASGLDAIDVWIEDHAHLFEDPEKAMRNHIEIPKGILISGIPGSGKSLMAKSIAQKLKLPLISLDMGEIMGSYVGESEHNMINALMVADNMSPCVLWVDEIEKAFSGSSKNSSSSDGGIGRRLFGKFLTWMQEKSSSCFVFATSNDISGLPPELFRSERFDRKFYTFMPMAEDCANIFAGIVKSQNIAYQKEYDNLSKEAKRQIPAVLFHENLERPNVWLDLLDECCTSTEEVLTHNDDGVFMWKNEKKPSNKLLTGADIASVVKEAKFKIFSSMRGAGGKDMYVYDENAFLNAVKKTISSIKPYGETNLKDIASCFRSLYENCFQPASYNSILNFDDYDAERKIYAPLEATSPRFKHKYDRVLFYTLVGAINHYSK